ncbi:MAG: carbohydrate binding domain-containing protein [Armatimonadota bacterium]
MYRLIGFILAAVLVGAVNGAYGAPQGAADFTLREELNRQWTRECVTFALTAEQLVKAQGSRPLLDDKGKEVIYQVTLFPPGTRRISFQTSLAPLETRTFTFADTGKADKTTDLQVADDKGWIVLSNSKTGIRLALESKVGGQGPIAGIRLPSGAWAGGSRLAGTAPVKDISCGIIKGPVFVEAIYKLTFADTETWEGRFRMYANEPVILVDEISSVDTPVTLQLMLSDNFDAESLFFRSGDSPYGKNLTWKIEKGLVFDWEPWLRWHASVRRGSVFSVCNEKSNDLLSVAARFPGTWVDPKIPWEKQAGSILKVLKDDAGVHADLPLRHGQRKWMLGAFNKTESLAIMQDPKREAASPIPYQYLTKYGQFPLDMIKDYVLRWPSALGHPRLFILSKDVARFRAGITDMKPYQARVAYYLNNPSQLTQFTMDDAVPAYLATQDPKLTALMTKQAIDTLQYNVNYMIDQDEGLPYGAAPHHQSSLATAVGIADLVYSSPDITPEQRDRLRVLAAFLGYTIARPDYWSEARGYAANPNMTTSVYGYLTSLAAFIPDHPSAKAWAQEGLGKLKEQLDTWSDDNGGWLEAPHYAMVSYDQILGVFLLAYNAGFNDWLYTDPKVKTVIRWFAQIDTPPDSRIGGFRHRPAVGNTYMCEPNGEFGILAYLFREKDPKFAAEMQWQYKQNNMYGTAGVGGFFPAFAGYRKLLTDPNLPESAPKYGSALFPKTGVVLRDHYPSTRETYLHMIHGEHHAHYDDDSGSVILFGKGRILSDEYGYYGCTPQEDHSMVESATAGHGIMSVRDFVKGPRFDYVSGVKEGWTRQIALIKGAAPEDPCYFVMNDSLRVASQAIWRLWLTAQEVLVQGQAARAVGKEDVDLDIVFLTPNGVSLRTETKERTSGSGMHPNWNWSPYKYSQIGLIANQRSDNFNVVLYPRLKASPAPACTVLAGGKGVKVSHEAGMDYVFLSSIPFNFDEGDIHFTGTVGMVQIRGKDTQLALGAGGKLSARGKTVVNNTPLPKVSKNLWPNNGDFENGSLAPLQARSDGKATLSLHQGNPAPGDTMHQGKYCAAVTLKEKGNGVFFGGYSIPVDSTRIYRISMKVYTDTAIGGQFGGYGVNTTTQNVKTAAGRIWEWSVYTTGPTKGWKTLETTIGPEGSGAKIIWPPGINSTHITCRISGEPGVIYLDDITVEPQ